MPNLEKHIKNIREFLEMPVVALNRFSSDTEPEIQIVRERCEELGAAFAVTEARDRGADGAVKLAQTVLEHAEKQPRPFRPLYEPDLPVLEKIARVAQRIYGARDVRVQTQARMDLALIERLGYARLPMCIAKTQSSLSDDPSLLGRLDSFELGVRRLLLQAGAGFLVVLAGEVLLMPGLPAVPRAESIDLLEGKVIGLD